MSKKIILTVLMGTIGISLVFIGRTLFVKKRAIQKRVDELRSSQLSTPYPYEYTL